MEYTSGWAATMDGGSGPLQFLGPLRAFGKDGNWFITLYALPPGKTYEEVRHENTIDQRPSSRGVLSHVRSKSSRNVQSVFA
jgi:hypothetical protein